MNCRVEIFKKSGYSSHSTKDEDTIKLKNSLTSIKINKSRSTLTSEANISVQFQGLPLAEYQGGNVGVVDNFALMKVYVDEEIEFTGVIKKYYYNEEDKIMNLNCHDMSYRLLNATDETIEFTNITAVGVIENLVYRVELPFIYTGGIDYSISNLKVEEGTVYLDVIQSLLETMQANIRATKSGEILLEEQYPDYTEGAGDANHFDWTYEDRENTASTNAGRDASLMRNVIKIKCGKNYDKFEEPSMTLYLNGEKWYDTIENQLANTQTKRKSVAGYKFLDMWRNSTPLTTLPALGNKYIDLSQIVKLVRDDTPPGYYLVVGVDTEINADNYQDTLQLQGMRDKRTIYQIPILLSSGVDKEVS